MSAMIDATCSKCGRRIGWYGTIADRPACPRCGHRPPRAELDAAEAEMQAFRDRLATHPRNADADTRRQQRLDAGLTLRQAAKLLNTTPTNLSAIEQGTAIPSTEMADRMAEVYGMGEG